MGRRINVRFILAAAAILTLSGCAYPVSRAMRDSAINVDPSVVVENPDAYKGDIVIWGGKIIQTHNLKDGTDIYVLSMPLDYQKSPVNDQVTNGRFIARTTQYLDPALYVPGKEVTIAGMITGIEKHPVGDRQYSYPVIDIKEMHLWKPQTAYVYPGWYGPDPFWFGPPFYGPYFYYDAPDHHFNPGFHNEMHEVSEHGEQAEHGK